MINATFLVLDRHEFETPSELDGSWEGEEFRLLRLKSGMWALVDSVRLERHRAIHPTGYPARVASHGETLHHFSEVLQHYEEHLARTLDGIEHKSPRDAASALSWPRKMAWTITSPVGRPKPTRWLWHAEMRASLDGPAWKLTWFERQGWTPEKATPARVASLRRFWSREIRFLRMHVERLARAPREAAVEPHGHDAQQPQGYAPDEGTI